MSTVHSLLCSLQDWVVVIFLVLIGLVLSLQVGPTFLRVMTLHGKLRQTGANGRAASSSKYSHQRNNASPIWQIFRCISEGEYWMVPKQRFLHFYVVGTISLVMGIYFSSSAVVNTAATSPNETTAWFWWWWKGQEQQQQLQQQPSPSLQLLVAPGLLLLHILRRWYECLYVHQWRSTSLMHFSAYLVGIFYYAILPFMVCHFSRSICGNNIKDTEKRHQTVHAPFETMIPESIPSLIQIGCVILCLYAQQQQARHHSILATLRLRQTNEKQRQIILYQLPEGGWFPWVACPHYLAEILFYLGLAGLVPDLTRGGILVAWVAVTLTTNALQSQKWYQENIPGYAQRNRKAIFPWLL